MKTRLCSSFIFTLWLTAAGMVAANLNAAVPPGGAVSSPTEDTALANADYVRLSEMTTPTDGWHNSGLIGPRRDHTAVWTGSEMIIWGGVSGGSSSPPLNTGGRYNPVGNSWMSLSTNGAPAARYNHLAVWTGTEMIVWGGTGGSTGGRYNPVGNSWTAMNTAGAPDAGISGAPGAYPERTAVWTGSEMIVWGGPNLGGRYNPAGDSWTAVSTVNAPSARRWHTAVWADSAMIVWGGYDGISPLNDGGFYIPAGNYWVALSTNGVPAARFLHTAVWTGTEMVVWGGGSGGGQSGLLTDGGRFNTGIANSWTAVNTNGAPPARYGSTAVWTGSEMIVLDEFGSSGGRYNPAGNSWAVMSSYNISREQYTAVWTGSEMIVWGGHRPGALVDTRDSGARYNPVGNSWTATGLPDGPFRRTDHTAVWTGSEMIVWGGTSDTGVQLGDGGRYSLTGRGWVPVSAVGAPTGRAYHTAVWTGSEMIIWGGCQSCPGSIVNTGGRYNSALNSWTPVATNGAPSARRDHTAVWTGTEMIVWGDGVGNTGGRYSPASDSWTTMNTNNAPPGRRLHTAVWTGSEMIVWGGDGGGNTGGRYKPASDSWTTINTYGAHAEQLMHTAVWTGNEMLIRGGFSTDVQYYFLNGPQLSLFKTPTNTAVITWPLWFTPFTLLQNVAVGSNNWIQVTNPITVASSENRVIFSPPTGIRFFQLQHP